MPISQIDKLFFIHIPRTGGTSLEQDLNMYKKGLASLSGPAVGAYDEYASGKDIHDQIIRRNNVPKEFCESKVGLQHRTYLEIKKFVSDNKDALKGFKKLSDEIDLYQTFTIVRNPWTKIISHWWSSTRPKWNTHRRAEHTIPDQIATISSDLDAFVKSISKMEDAELKYSRDSHLRPQWHFIATDDDQESFDVDLEGKIRIMRYEMYARDISAMFGDAPSFPAHYGLKDLRPSLELMLSDYAIDEIGKIYKEDISLFGFTGPGSSPYNLSLHDKNRTNFTPREPFTKGGDHPDPVHVGEHLK